MWLRSTIANRIVVNLENRITANYLVRSTAYPYYIAWNDTTNDRYVRNQTIGSFAAFTEPPPPAPAMGMPPPPVTPNGKYQAMMRQLIAQLGSAPADDYIAQCVALGLAARRQRDYMSGIVKVAWDALSEVGVDSLTPVVVNAVAENRYRIIDDQHRVMFVKTLFRPFNRERRLRADGYLDSVSYPVMRMHTDPQLVRALRTSPLGFPYNALALVIGAIRRRVPITWRPTYDKVLNASRTAALKFQKVARSLKVMAARRTDNLARGQFQNVAMLQAFAELRRTAVAGGPALLASVPSVTPTPTQDFVLVPDVDGTDWTKVSHGPAYRVPLGPTDADLDNIAVFMMMLEQTAITLSKDFVVAVDDPFRVWILQALRETTPSTSKASIAFSLTGVQTKTNVSAITLTLPATATRPSMVFSTSTLVGNFSDRSLPSMRTKPPLVEKSGFYPMHSFLCLGLKPDSTAWTLSQVFMQINVGSTTGQNLGAVLGAVMDVFAGANQPTFVMKRGMIWFLPQESYLTVQRLEWGLGPSAEQAFTSWCKDWMPRSFVIRNPTLVSRRNCTRIDTPTNTGLRFGHEMLFMFEIARDGVEPAKDYIITCGLDLNLQDGSESLIASIRVDPASADAKVGLLDFVGWLVPQVDISSVGNIIPVLENVLIRSVELKIVKGDKGISVDQIVVKAEYSNPSWKVPGPNGQKVNVPFLVRTVL